jgi:RNA polymerase sigma factor (sigma-70 family)
VTKPAASRQFLSVSESDRPPGSGPDDFDAVYERELDYVWRTLGRLGVPPGDLADAAHDVFVVLYRRWAELDPERPVRGWLFGIARKVAAGRRRKAREILEAAPEPAPDADVHAHSAGAQHAERDLLWRALALLDEARCEVLVLHDLEGHTGSEIANMLELPVNTVHSRLRLARAELLAAVQRLRRSR